MVKKTVKNAGKIAQRSARSTRPGHLGTVPNSGLAGAVLTDSYVDLHRFGRRFSRVLAPVTYHPFSEAMSLAASLGEHVRVLHVVQYHNALHGGGFSFEPEHEAARLVQAAAFDLHLKGATASTAVVRAPVHSVASSILQDAIKWGAEAIVLGSYRDRGIGKLKGKGIREHIVRNSNLTVVVAPTIRRRKREATTP
jgi:nucleotide-binding universal stress UspA family protein